MVSRCGQIIARLVHQLNNGCTLVHRTVSGSLEVIARIHQKDISVFLLQLLFQRTDGIITQRAVYIRVRIVGVQNYDIIGFLPISGRCGHAQ